MNDNYVKVDNHSGLIRDKKSGAIININKSEAEKARRLKAQRLSRKEQEAQLRDDVDNLKSEMNSTQTIIHA